MNNLRHALTRFTCRAVVALLIPACLGSAQAQAQDSNSSENAKAPILPKAHPLQRYSTLWERSPFVLEVVIEEPAPVAGAFDGLSVVGVFSSGDLQMATLYNAEKNERYVVTNKPQPGDEFILENLTSGTDLDSTSITLRTPSGTETGTIRGSSTAVQSMKKKQPTPPANPQAAQQNNRPPTPPKPNAQKGGKEQEQSSRRRRVIRPRTISNKK